MRAGGTKAALNSVISVPALRKAMVGVASPGVVARLSPAVNSQPVTWQPHAWQPEFVLGQWILFAVCSLDLLCLAARKRCRPILTRLFCGSPKSPWHIFICLDIHIFRAQTCCRDEKAGSILKRLSVIPFGSLGLPPSTELQEVALW